MFGYNPYLLKETLREAEQLRPDRDVQALQRAVRLFERALLLGRVGRLWSVVLGRSHHLAALATVEARVTISDRFYAGTYAVPLSRIRGSEGRSGDFDLAFRPLQSHSRERWLGVAIACQQGVALPPVELIQLGDVYFIRDGHHRVSAARALGQGYIEAAVTVWQVAGLLPWEQPMPLRTVRRTAP
ncbi:MAG: hypothetical protein M5U01_38290 [Ardenticatenaceae bacterium]|nr:hypothetical protein [Ardenticatenaceae bacterium]